MEQQRISEMLSGIDDDLLMETMALDGAKKRRWTSTTLGKIAMAACLPLLCAAGIATGLLVDVVEVFSPFLGNTPVQTEIIQEIGRPIGATATDNGITITAEAIIGDNNKLYTVFKVAQENGMPLEIPDTVSIEEIILSGAILFSQEGESYGNSKITLGEDGHYRIIYMQASPNNALIGKTVVALFSRLGYWNEGSYQSLVEGIWEIKYEINYVDSTLLIEVNEEFTRQDVTFMVDSILVSPLGLHVNYTFDGIPSMFPNYSDEVVHLLPEEVVCYTELELTISLKDGREWNLRSQGSGTHENGDTLAYRTSSFDEIIPLEDIFSITVGDIVLILADYLN